MCSTQSEGAVLARLAGRRARAAAPWQRRAATSPAPPASLLAHPPLPPAEPDPRLPPNSPEGQFNFVCANGEQSAHLGGALAAPARARTPRRLPRVATPAEPASPRPARPHARTLPASPTSLRSPGWPITGFKLEAWQFSQAGQSITQLYNVQASRRRRQRRRRAAARCAAACVRVHRPVGRRISSHLSRLLTHSPAHPHPPMYCADPVWRALPMPRVMTAAGGSSLVRRTLNPGSVSSARSAHVSCGRLPRSIPPPLSTDHLFCSALRYSPPHSANFMAPNPCGAGTCAAPLPCHAGCGL